MKRRMISCEEHDVHTRWRRIMCRYNRPGQSKKAKRRTNRRERREGRVEARTADRA